MRNMNITIVVVDSTNGETYPFFLGWKISADRVQQYILGRRGPKTETLVQEETIPLKKALTNTQKAFICRIGGSLRIIRPSLSCPCLLQAFMKVWICLTVLWIYWSYCSGSRKRYHVFCRKEDHFSHSFPCGTF